MSLKTFIKINNGLCFSVKCACFALQSLSKFGDMRDKHTRTSASMFSLDLYFVLMTVTAELQKMRIRTSSWLQMAKEDTRLFQTIVDIPENRQSRMTAVALC